MPRRPSGQKIRLKPAKPGGRPNRISDPTRLPKEAVARALAELKKRDLLRGKFNIGRIANLIVNEGTSSGVTVGPYNGSIVYHPPPTLSADKLLNQSKYTTQIIRGTSASRARYSVEEVAFVLNSAEVVFILLAAPDSWTAAGMVDILVKNYGWSQTWAKRLGEFAVMLHASQASYFMPPTIQSVVTLKKVLQDHKVRLDSLLSSDFEQS